MDTHMHTHIILLLIARRVDVWQLRVRLLKIIWPVSSAINWIGFIMEGHYVKERYIETCQAHGPLIDMKCIISNVIKRGGHLPVWKTHVGFPKSSPHIRQLIQAEIITLIHINSRFTHRFLAPYAGALRLNGVMTAARLSIIFHFSLQVGIFSMHYCALDCVILK